MIKKWFHKKINGFLFYNKHFSFCIRAGRAALYFFKTKKEFWLKLYNVPSPFTCVPPSDYARTIRMKTKLERDLRSKRAIKAFNDPDQASKAYAKDLDRQRYRQLANDLAVSYYNLYAATNLEEEKAEMLRQFYKAYAKDLDRQRYRIKQNENY